MSTAAPSTLFTAAPPATESRHRRLLHAGYVVAVMLIVGLGWYGFNYYLLSSGLRPFSPKHLLLRPNGDIGLGMGLVGTLLFIGIFLYPLRKRWAWLRARGSTRHWLDFHVLMGLTAPLVIVLHAAFKFKGLAGMAFWIMAAVAISGVAGRYLYSQIPRSLSAAELSLQEARQEQSRLTGELAQQKVFPAALLSPLSHFPDEARIRNQWILLVLLEMLWGDLRRFYWVSRLRRLELGLWGTFVCLGGVLSSGNVELELVITIARKQALLSQRLLFLSRSQRVFHLWHVVHKPFSYSFAVLALVHIAVVLLFGVR